MKKEKEKEKKRKRDKAAVSARDTDEMAPSFSVEFPAVTEKEGNLDSMDVPSAGVGAARRKMAASGFVEFTWWRRASVWKHQKCYSWNYRHDVEPEPARALPNWIGGAPSVPRNPSAGGISYSSAGKLFASGNRLVN